MISHSWGTRIQRTHEKQILDTEEGLGETPGSDKHRHADNSKLPPHEFCSCLNLLDIFIKACSSFGKKIVRRAQQDKKKVVTEIRLEMRVITFSFRAGNYLQMNMQTGTGRAV